MTSQFVPYTSVVAMICLAGAVDQNNSTPSSTTNQSPTTSQEPTKPPPTTPGPAPTSPAPGSGSEERWRPEGYGFNGPVWTIVMAQDGTRDSLCRRRVHQL